MEQHIKQHLRQHLKQHLEQEISLNRFFIFFLAHTVLSLFCAGALWAALLFAVSDAGIIIPANAVELSLAAWRDTLDGHRTIAPEEIPDGAGYAFFNPGGLLLQTSLEGDALHTAAKLAAASKTEQIWRTRDLIYFRIDTDTQRIVVAYRLVALFSPPLLRRLFPNAELFFFLLLLAMLIAALILTAAKYARKLNRELEKLAAAAEQISRQNLSFPTHHTKIREFNQIMHSLDYLKENLEHSLKTQWAMEQQKKQQLTALAHDIKTPLSIITGNAELLLETEQTEEQRRYAAFILEHAGQIRQHVTGMLDLFRTGNVSAGTCQIREMLLAAARNTEVMGKNKRLSCSLSMEDLPDTLPVAKDGLQRILDNLTDNAVQYSPENGTVFLSARLSGRTLQLSIRDEGDGFSGEALALATTPFYRSDQSRSSREHFGLGLSIARQIVTRLGGTLCLENAPGKGASVTVRIPVAGSGPEDSGVERTG